MNLKFLSVTLKNFLSIGNCQQSLNLNEGGLTLILGNNVDAANLGGGLENCKNGVGKSSLLQAISYGLYGEPLTNIKLDNLINFINQKGMLVTIEFEVNGIHHRIERGRKPNIFRFFKDNKEVNDSLGENKHTQEDVNKLIGMDHTLFCHIVAMNTYTTPFLKMKPADQRQIIEELLGVVTLSERDEKLMEIVRETKRLIKDEESMVRAVSDSNVRIQTAIDKGIGESIAWETSHDALLSKLQMSLSDMIDIDFDAEIERLNEIDAFNAEVAAIEATVAQEQRETVFLKKDLQKFLSTKIGLEQDLSKLSNTQIDRLKIEARRCDDESKKTCDAEIKKIEGEILRCEREAQKTCDSEVAKIETQISRRKTDAAKKVADSEEKMAALTVILNDIENSDAHTCSTCGQGIEGTDHLQTILDKLAKKAETLEKQIEKDVVEVAALEQEVVNLQKEIDDVKAEHERIQSQWLTEAENLRLQITSVKENHSIVQEDWQNKAVKIRTEIASLEQELLESKASLQDKIDEIILETKTLSETISERENIEETYQSEIASMKAACPKPITYFSKEETWKAKEKFNSLMKDFETENSKENPHIVYVNSLKETLQEINYDNLNQYQDDLKHQEFIHKLLTAKDSFIRKKIIDRNLFLLNSKMTSYLTTLGLPHDVKFKPDLSVEISFNGKDVDFEQLSRGEMNRVILSVSWAFRDVWEDLNKHINLSWVDENLDIGTDSSGVNAALEILNKMAKKKTVFLVSHKEELLGQVDKVLTVHKEDGFTRLESS